jgi:nicotinate phosphoribosyltransferase
MNIWLVLPFFSPGLSRLAARLPLYPGQVTVTNDNGKLNIRLSGPWREVIMWEVPLLAVISELVHRYRSPEISVDSALETLEHKLADFAPSPLASICPLPPDGLRHPPSFLARSAAGHRQRLQQEPWFVGTSNYDLARRLHLTPMGTQAHEWFQAHQQISPTWPAASARRWPPGWKSILTTGHRPDRLHYMDAFLRDFGPEFATRYGLRHDSGDPVEWGEKAIAHYQKLGIDP